MTSLSRMSAWRHEHQKLSWNFEVLISNSGYAPGRTTAKVIAYLRQYLDYSIDIAKDEWQQKVIKKL